MINHVELTERSLFLRNVYNVVELLDRIYLEHGNEKIYSREKLVLMWKGVESFMRVMALLRSRAKPEDKKYYEMPVICRFEGHA